MTVTSMVETVYLFKFCKTIGWLAASLEQVHEIEGVWRSDLIDCLSHCSTAVNRHHDHGNSSKGKHSIGAGLPFRGLVHYHQGEKHGGMQADVGLDWQAAGRESDTGPGLSIWNLNAHPSDILLPTRPHLLIRPLPMSLWGAFLLKLPKWLKNDTWNS